MKYGIVGSRRRTDRENITNFVATLPPGSVVISGGAAGPDTWAAEAARARGLETTEYLPDLSNCKQRWEYAEAYYERNLDIALNCDVLVAFVAANRKGGTEKTIKYAQKLGKSIIIMPPGA